MALAEQDRIDITDLINLHGHFTDAGDLDQAGALFTPDVTYDLDDFGLGSLQGTAALREAALASGDANPVGHHVTNIVVTQIDECSARVRSKGIGVKADGTVGSVAYDDIVTRGPDGWKISYRKVTARRAALGKHEAGAEAGTGTGAEVGAAAGTGAKAEAETGTGTETGIGTGIGTEAGPRELLERCRQAAISQSVEDMRRVYAPDAVHEFPFAFPGVPARLEGRDEIVDWIAAGWAANPLRYERYRTLAVHDTGDPETIIVEQEALGASPSTGAFTLPNIIVLTARHGQIAHLRDYVDIPAAAAALGQEL